ncbi:OX-2 membrane glycoprotein-like isoform X3 [Xiphophorus maculatus]|uniref:OX-2 membrane glycoprotein-like isoform X3 n=1 Tax=Xiphophorus maculatus TaxID=8083 RepID=UPI000C6EFC46|nr:OX-2 membrane glycoprotein-like isoform X3 [Xiphophorus maculatus]
MKYEDFVKDNKMFPPVITSCFLITTILQTALAVLIQTQQTVLAAVGEDAPLSCRLLVTKDVQQVTWQKVLEKTERSISSYSQYFGETVNPGFKDKVQFTEAGLQKNSIVIRNVTEQDAGCYLCLFNTYPDGALIAGTCLEVYELHGPFIENLSFSHYNTSRVSNTNGTVTFTTTVLLSALNSTQIGCSVSVDSAAPRELLVTVPGLTETSDSLDEDFESDDKDKGRLVAVAMGLLVILCGAFGCLTMLWFRKRHQNRKEKNPTEQTRNNQSEEFPIPEKDKKVAASLINRQSSKQSSPTTPTTPDIESCSPEGMKLHQKLTAKKSEYR